MRVEVFRNESELQKLATSWDELLRASGSDTIFLTWDWITVWWSTYGQPGCLHLIAALDDKGTIRGIAPLRTQTLRKYGRTIEALTYIGDGSNDSDYLDFIIAAGWEEKVMDAFSGYLARELSRNRILLLNELPEASPNFIILKRLVERLQSTIWMEESLPCATVRLPECWEDYLKTLRPRFRTKVRSVLRNLEERPDVRFGLCESQQQLETLLPVLYDLHTRRWALEGKPGVFGWGKKREFYVSLSKSLLERGLLRLTWLEWQGTVLACQYGFRYRDTYYQLQEGYEPASDHWNVGVGLRAWSIRKFLGEGILEYDFMAGVGRHKTDWGAEVKHSKRVVVAGDGYWNRLFCSGPKREAKLRESARRILPPRLLAALKARRGEKHLSAPKNDHRDRCAWVRQLAAKCYFRLGLPAVTRRLRERYEVSVSRNGTLPKISGKRRQETSARILYYHRVNNDNDPFFPSISTDLFEQEMRFVAGHYKVVSLSDALRHLEDGKPGNPVVITFDDGYSDNYDNAFPILQRYSLPATIFLTTGAVDLGEPLWFEQLALAMQNTDRECIDLEIGIPRRFWFRTRGERIQSNGRIFDLLRSVTDEERQAQMVRILRELAVTTDERKNKMLTWDQIRLMKSRGVDFGGHTVTHPFLSKLTDERARWELSESKRRIEYELQEPVHHFAYPNGREEDFTQRNKELLRSVGYQAALTTIWGLNDRGTDRMELKRGQPWEDNIALFAYKLDWYQLANQ